MLSRAALLFTVVGCATVQPAGSKTVSLVESIRRADYQGDRAALERLYAELAPVAEGKQLASRVRYWRGFAIWRRAFNGFNDGADPPELERDLTRCVSEFEESLAIDPAFTDAKVGEASCTMNLAFLRRKDPAQAKELIPRIVRLLREAQAVAPDNPRLLWVVGVNQWYTPPQFGGGQDKAFATYQAGLSAARRQTAPADPLEPSWGEPELLMNLGFANLNRATPDLEAADRYAREALALVPYWHYVRDILLPQIQKAAANN